MSNQKYRRTNFEEEENSRVELPSPSANFDPMVGFQQYKLNFWRRRSTLEKVLGILFIISLLIITILAIVIHVKSLNKPTINEVETRWKNTCFKKSCMKAASSILNAIDEHVDPCENFYDFACGNWIRSNPIPNGHSDWDTFTILKEENSIILKRFFDTPLNESHSESQIKAKKFFNSCMDPKEEIDKIGSAPLVDIMTKFGGWTVSDVAGSWNETAWNLQESLQLANAYGISVLFTIMVGEDEKDPDRNILKVDQPSLQMSREAYVNKTAENDKMMAAYLKYMTSLSVLMGGAENETNNIMAELLEFERSLAEIMITDEDRRDDDKYNKRNISYLQEVFPFINWLDFINAQLSMVNITVNESEPILLLSPEYFTKLISIINGTLNKENGTRLLQNYIVWNVVDLYSSYLSKPFKNVKKEFINSIAGINGEKEKWKYCVMETEAIMGFVLSTDYVKEKFSDESKNSSLEMVRRIKEAFINNIPNLAWMDEETRVAAIDKAKAVIDKIGYPDLVLNVTELDMKFQDLEINEDEYFMNNYRSIMYNLNLIYGKLRTTNDKLSWSMTPQCINAYYNPSKNEIVFPAGILQAPFYHKEYPKSLNFGAVGIIMGHELIHGFDDQGRRYDKNGILRMWWNEKIIQEFQRRTQCMVDQYSNYSVNGDNLKGKLTLGENIADNGGLKSSYYAYQQYLRENDGQDILLPGIPYTNEQLFFISFARVWCANINAADMKLNIMNDLHSLPRFRVIGSISNFPEFSKQFNCKLGTPMNPNKKCEVW